MLCYFIDLKTCFEDIGECMWRPFGKKYRSKLGRPINHDSWVFFY